MSQPWVTAPRREVWAHGLFVLCRVLLTVSLLCVTYFLIPTRRPGDGFGVGWLALQLCVFVAIVGAQVPAIVTRIYVANSQNDPAGFSSPLDHVTALYFTVTVFATVGFGDIVALTNSMKMLVTVQMLLNLVVLGLGIRLLTSAARRGIARRGGQTDVGEPDRPGF